LISRCFERVAKHFDQNERDNLREILINIEN